MMHRNDIQPVSMPVIAALAAVKMPTIADFVWAHGELKRITAKPLN